MLIWLSSSHLLDHYLELASVAWHATCRRRPHPLLPPGDYSAPCRLVGFSSAPAGASDVVCRALQVSANDRCGAFAAVHWLQWYQVSPLPFSRTACDVLSVTWKGPVHRGSDHFLLITFRNTQSAVGDTSPACLSPVLSPTYSANAVTRL